MLSVHVRSEINSPNVFGLMAPKKTVFSCYKLKNKHGLCSLLQVEELAHDTLQFVAINCDPLQSIAISLEPEIKPELKPELETKLKPKLKPKLEPKLEPEFEPKLKPKLKPEPKLALKPKR